MRIITLSLLLLSISFTGFCTTWTINNSGATFTPATITIKLGDSVNFVIANSHNVLEVSQATYDQNGTTALLGGFQMPFGGGLVLPAQLGVGTHYYVCTPHASLSMKAIIIVESTTSIAEDKLATNVNVFPNPASDLITIEVNKNEIGSVYFVMDQSGRQVLVGELNRVTTVVDIKKLTTGIYFIQIGEQRKQTFKVVKK